MPAVGSLELTSALLPMRCNDLVDELQHARPPGGGIVTPRAAALEDALRVVRGVRHCCLDRAAEIEVPVAVGIRAAVFKKRTSRRIKHVRLGGRCAGTRPAEAQLNAKML